MLLQKVSYTLAWKPQDSETEYAVCLANVVLSKTTEDRRNNNTFNSDNKYL